MSLFSGLEIARTALSAQELALTVIGNNIANANTVGYSRQQPHIQQTDPIIIPVNSNTAAGLPIGTGVQIESITRSRDIYIDSSIQQLKSDFGRFDMERSELEYIETLFNEPSDAGLSDKLDKFFDSWVNLYSPDPSNSGARAEVRAAAIVLADTINIYNSHLLKAETDINNRISDRIDIINQVANEIASLNYTIASQSQLGNPNDLLDQRDRLLEDMSGLANMEIVVNENESVNVSIGGTLIVGGINVFAMSSITDADGTLPIWESSNAAVNLSSGELYGLQQVRDNNISVYLEDINDLADQLRIRFNAVHTAGYDQAGSVGVEFFTGSSADDLALNDSIEQNISLIAASGSAFNANGNGQNALALSQIRNETLFTSDTQTMEDFYISLLTDLGSRSGEVEMLRENQGILLEQLENRRHSISGVSIDEEMTEMMKYEVAYQAAAKFISTINRLADVVLGLTS